MKVGDRARAFTTRITMTEEGKCNVFQPTAVMTLAEAIEHAEEMGIGDSFCNANHRQLADWLKELRLLRRLGKCSNESR